MPSHARETSAISIDLECLEKISHRPWYPQRAKRVTSQLHPSLVCTFYALAFHSPLSFARRIWRDLKPQYPSVLP